MSVLGLSGNAFAVVKKGSTVRITLANGTTLIGEVVAETSQGLLISTGSRTELVPFASLTNVDDLSPVPAAAPATPPAAAPVAPREHETTTAPQPERPFFRFDGARWRYGAAVSGGVGPGSQGLAWGLGVEGVIAFDLSPMWSLRGILNYTHVQNGKYSTNLVVAMAMPTVWFGIYGLGAALVLGVGDISSHGPGAALGFLAAPARLRFGERIVHEVALELGAVFISSDPDLDPLFRLSYTLLF